MNLAVAARKGGVGKSSISSGLASLIAADGRAVLAVDLDPQSNLAFMLGGDPTAPGAAALLSGRNPTPLELTKKLHVLPGGPELARQDIARLDPEDLADALERYRYDVIIIDCPPGIEHLERLGIVAAEKALVVLNAHPLAVIGAGRVLRDLEVRKQKGRRGPRSWALVLNMLDARRRLDRSIDDMLEDAGEAPRFRVRQDANFSLATAQGVPLAEIAATSTAAQDLQKLKEWCLG